MAPSSTNGAVTRLLRNAAMNVTVFQFPCSTFWTSRSPCGARPYRRVIVVDTLVSSMNTSLLGSSLVCRRCNALRAAATSGRSCSAARKLFFKGQLQMMQKPGDRRLSDRDLFFLQSVFEFGQRDVWLLRYQLPHQILVHRQREIFVAAEFGRVDAARLPVKPEEADHRADADPALLRSFRDGGPALDRPDHSPTQIRRIWLRHACRPPPSRQLESYSRCYGNPRFSLFGKRSKSPSARFDQARSIRLRPNQSGTLNRALPPVQPRAQPTAKRNGAQPTAPTWLPKGAGTYADAKRHEQLGNFEAAEKLLPKAIDEGGRYRQSAIKDLAMLMGRRNRPVEGIELLDRYREEFDPKRPVDNLKASLLVKAGEYQKAANLYVLLYQSSARGTKDSAGPAKQAGYCFSLLSNFEDALKFFEAARNLSPGDSTITEAIKRIQRAKTIGILSADDTRQLQELAGLAVASGLSSFANFFMQMSDFKGADERSITRGFFEAGDFQKIDRQLRAIRGRQPRMKGQLYQTLAAM